MVFLANAHERHAAAGDHYAAALRLYRSTINLSGQASVPNETGWTYILLGAYDKALHQCGQAVSLHHMIGDTNGEAAALDSLGHAYHHMGRHSEAFVCYRRTLKLYQHMNDRCLEAATLLHMGDSQAGGSPCHRRGPMGTGRADSRRARPP
ncbi:hypothetical protein SUDANB105_07839 [Streptomyces sp. enrichment culture]|uniref:tetratricopeptide repeat protein n=1 Tax=Streptomyces sp. enrichment culture TaxID=1795815 RepID=UPI003F580134